MEFLNKKISSTHILTAALLTILAVAASYSLNQIPFSLLIAVITSTAISIIIDKIYLKRKIKIPISALITGLLIGSIAPINAPLTIIILACIIGELSRLFIRLKGSNIFNPAALGLIVSLAIFSIGDSWWAAINYNLYALTIPLSIILVLSAYKAKRMMESLSFIVVVIIISVLSNPSQISAQAILTVATSINYYFAFAMLSDPKTSPYKKTHQLILGVAIAILYFAFSVILLPYALLLSLLIGNLAYFVYHINSTAHKRVSN